MNNIERINLINEIASYFQKEYSTQEINTILAGYNFPFTRETGVTSKRVYVTDVLSNQDNHVIIRIARDIGFRVSEEPTPQSRTASAPGDSTLKNNTATRKIFLSHAVKDKEFADHLLDMLIQAIGVDRDNVFYSSAHGYGIGLGQNFIQRLKDELNGDVLVIFLMSDNFYSSTMCMCEMGATWVMARAHVPILIPPFDFSKVKGVFPNTQGMMINDRMAFTELAELLRQYLGMGPFKHLHWERDRNRICDRIDALLAAKSLPVDPPKPEEPKKDGTDQKKTSLFGEIGSILANLSNLPGMV